MVPGQIINFYKSSLTYYKKTSSSQTRLLSNLLNITRSDSLGNYMGCLAFHGRPNASTFQELISRTLTKLERWKANCLLKAGSTVLIQSHLESLPTHTMQCFSLSQKTSSMLNNLAKDFFGKKVDTQKGLPLILWDRYASQNEEVVSG